MNQMFDVIDVTPDFIVIYKKPGHSFHSEDGIGLFAAVKQQLNMDELYPVHRLDKVTSGVLLFARTAKANADILQQFKLRQIEKFYLAIGSKKPKKKQGLIKGNMVPARRGAWKLKTTLLKPAITQFFSLAYGNGKRLFIVKPHTGKTHQIRVALKSLGSPILGDNIYADKSTDETDRCYLHAYSLAFSLNGKCHRYTELPREGELFLSVEFASAIAPFATPWQLNWPHI